MRNNARIYVLQFIRKFAPGVWLFLIFLLFLAGSCKTCKCPAYSEERAERWEQRV